MKNHKIIEITKKCPSIIKNFLLATVIGLNACGDWLDVVPEGIATLDMAFTTKTQALKYLGTCYSYMPKNGGGSDPALLGSDEIWTRNTPHIRLRFSVTGLNISEGMQNAANPLLPRWSSLYQGLRVCNTFLENIQNVPDLMPFERDLWTAEVLVLKAYYHFCLVQMYGPVPLIRENLPIDVDVSTVKVEREPVDDCFSYIVELIDQAVRMNILDSEVISPESELGRITKPVALTLKAKILVTAASPLFNGNNDQVTLKNRDGKPLFNATEDSDKWRIALEACKEAIEACHDARLALYRYTTTGISFSPTIMTDLSLREAFCGRWNSDIIWANTQMIATPGDGGMIFMSTPKLFPDKTYAWSSGQVCAYFAVPVKIAQMFHTSHGVPLEEDNTRDVRNLYHLRTATADDALYIRSGRTTIDMHFGREPRFYSWVGFDGGVWFGADVRTETNISNLRWLAMKANEIDGNQGQGNWSGYIPKKHVPWEAQLTADNRVDATSYAWPILRMSDLYLLYAEAINEYEGPKGANSKELFDYIDMVRDRAGLQGVKFSWDNFTNKRGHYDEKHNMREIIQRERMIELAFEGQRFWDVRRWKIAPEIYKTSLEGWNMLVSSLEYSDEEANRIFYTPQLLLKQEFGIRDYFWPIRTSDIDINPNLVQNIGW